MEQGPSGIGDGYVSQVPSASRATRSCVSCGRVIDWHVNVCPYCGHDYRQVLQPSAPAKTRSSKPAAAGILFILAGLVAIGMGAIFLMIDTSDLEEADIDTQGDITLREIEEIAEACGALSLLFGAIAVIGGIFAIMRKYFYFALIGGVIGMIGFGFLFALIGVILLALSRAEFEAVSEQAKKSEYHY